jgi:hypothetical protein
MEKRYSSIHLSTRICPRLQTITPNTEKGVPINRRKTTVAFITALKQKLGGSNPIEKSPYMDEKTCNSTPLRAFPD